MITNIEFERKLRKITEELFSDLYLDFVIDRQQMTIFTAWIRITNSISVDRNEVIYNGEFNELKLRKILKVRMRDALLNLKDLIEKELEKL